MTPGPKHLLTPESYHNEGEKICQCVKNELTYSGNKRQAIVGIVAVCSSKKVVDAVHIDKIAG